MHRKIIVPRSALGVMLLVPLLAGITMVGQAPAQEQAPPPAEEKDKSTSAVVQVSVGETRPLQMAGKGRLKSWTLSRGNVVGIRADPLDLRTLQVQGAAIGQTTLTVVDEMGVREVYEIEVIPDIAYVRRVLQEAVPASNLKLIPSGNDVIIGGSVGRAEDVNTVMNVANSALGTGRRAINAMRISGVHQVQLDVMVAQVRRDEFRRMAIDFYNFGQNHQLLNGIGGSIIAPTFQIDQSQITFQFGSGQPNGAPANIFGTLINNQQALFYYFQLLRDEGVAKLLSQPKIVTMSGRQAFFLSGGEQAVPQPGGLGAVSVQFRPFGTTINVLPIVLGNGKIYLEVEPEVSRLDQAAGTTVAGFTVAGRATQRVRTTVEMEAGQTFVIGGLIEHVVNGATQKVPVLGDLPFIGTLFSRKSFQEFETELVIMVTPYLVDPMSCDQVAKALPGQETRAPDDFELFLEGILEAPRGPRDVCVHRHYVPAYKHSPSADKIPCAGQDTTPPQLHSFINKGGCGGCATCPGGACVGGACTPTESFGSGLANDSSISYPGVAPDHAAEMPVGDSTRKAELMAPVDLNEASEPTGGVVPMPYESKPNSLPSVFGPAGR